MGLVIAAGVGGWATYRWALETPRFALRRVEFKGLARVSDADLRRMAAMSPGQNLFLVDLAALERTMASHPWVRSVHVARRWPDALRVDVLERRAVALAALSELYLVDDSGEPFKRLDVEDEVDLPLITGMTREEYVAAPEQGAERLRGALERMRAFEARGRGKLSEVRLAGSASVLVTTEGLVVHLGDGPLPEQLSRLERIADELGRRGLTASMIRLDDRARPGRVAVKLAGGVPDRARAGR